MKSGSRAMRNKPSYMMRQWQRIRLHAPPLNFITIHYAYFIGLCMLSSIIFWGASTPAHSISYTDSLFLVVSAMTLAGLNTVNLSILNTFQQFLLFLLIMLGSAILVSILVVHTRRTAFEKRFKHVVDEERRKKRARSGSRRRNSTSNRSGIEVDNMAMRGRPIQAEEKPHAPSGNDKRDTLSLQAIADEDDMKLENSNSRRITFASPSSPTRERAHSRLFAMQGVGARKNVMNHPNKTGSPVYPEDIPSCDEDHEIEPQGGFLSRALIGRNSQFSSLSLSDRERLGGVEYRAITMLAFIVPVYFVLWQLLGSIGMGAYVAAKRPDVTLSNGLNPWWVGAFNAVSAFNNSGMSLLDANMTAFQTSDYTLLTAGLLILAGNTCYPVFLRLIIWTMWKLLPSRERYQDHKNTLRFLLDHPRRCYTNLFPSRHTWWLAATLIMLNGTDWIAFEVLNIGNPTVTTLPHGARALDGLFQALAVRSGGFYVVAIPNLRIGLLILYVIMMYISVYPVVITMRNSNVYEERSLGIYSDDPLAKLQADDSTANGNASQLEREAFGQRLRRRLTGQTTASSTHAVHPNSHDTQIPINNSSAPESRGYFVRQQLRSQLSHDLWWIVLAVLFITITETSSFEADPVTYSVFNILFEVVSAYGCVGISVGLPNVAYSFCGGWHVLSKLILCAVMLRGRHRGLPVAIDRAVLLPGENLARAEEEDAWIRGERARGRFDKDGQTAAPPPPTTNTTTCMV